MVSSPATEFRRYSRQMMLRGFGEEGQRRLKKSRVAVAGIGGLGSPASLYLAAAGVGYIRLIDFDIVDISNLNRQVAHWSTDLGRPKVESAAMKLTQLNPDITADAVNEKITGETVGQLLEGIDIVIDGQDNLPTRLLINSECVSRGIPYVFAAVHGFEGYLTTIMPGKGPCLRCIYPSEALPDGVIPVIGPTPGVMGCLEATEAIKLIVGIGTPTVGRLVVYDGERMSFQQINIKQNPKCPTCGKSR
jgi:molybdopterin/thiamine biosynthesis adenylyltransferase